VRRSYGGGCCVDVELFPGRLNRSGSTPSDGVAFVIATKAEASKSPDAFLPCCQAEDPAEPGSTGLRCERCEFSLVSHSTSRLKECLIGEPPHVYSVGDSPVWCGSLRRPPFLHGFKDGEMAEVVEGAHSPWKAV